MEITTPDTSHLGQEEFDEVYEPAEDSFLLLDALELDLENIIKSDPRIVVEIGSGSGVISTALSGVLPSALVLATDVNPAACRATQLTSKKNKAKVQVVRADVLTGLCDRLAGQIDLVVCNPPYVSTEDAEVGSTGISAAWAGGCLGLEVTRRVVGSLESMLSPSGSAYIVLEQCNQPDHYIKEVSSQGFNVETLISRRAGRELLSVIKVNRLQRFYSILPLSEYVFSSNFPAELRQEFADSFIVHGDFATAKEEVSLMKEFEPHLKRHVYEKDHWDNAICGFRETEKKQFQKINTPVIDRLKKTSFPESGKNSRVLPYTHVLDLAEDGHIKPHVDSTRFCGDRVAVLSLLSDSVGRFCLEKDKSVSVDVLIPRLSLYIMKGVSRYDFTHEILGNEESYINGQQVRKGRRISVICRNEP